MTPQTLTVAASTSSAFKIYGSGEDAVYALNDVSVEFYEGQFTAKDAVAACAGSLAESDAAPAAAVTEATAASSTTSEGDPC